MTSTMLDKCAECGADFYSDAHVTDCSREENIDQCGVCDYFYHNQGKSIPNPCQCNREVE